MARKRIATTRWDVVDHLQTDEQVAAYLEAVLEDGDPRLIVAAIGDIAREGHDAACARNRTYPRRALQGIRAEWQPVLCYRGKGGALSRRAALRSAGGVASSKAHKARRVMIVDTSHGNLRHAQMADAARMQGNAG